MNTSTKHSHTLVSGTISEEGVQRLYESEIKEYAVRLCLLVTSEVIPMKYHLTECANVN